MVYGIWSMVYFIWYMASLRVWWAPVNKRAGVQNGNEVLAPEACAGVGIRDPRSRRKALLSLSPSPRLNKAASQTRCFTLYGSIFPPYGGVARCDARLRRGSGQHGSGEAAASRKAAARPPAARPQERSGEAGTRPRRARGVSAIVLYVCT